MSDEKRSGGRLNLGLIYPLGGILIAYLLVLVTTYVETAVNVDKQRALGAKGGNIPEFVHPWTYLVLLIIAILVVSSLIGRRISGGRLGHDANLRLNRNVYGFTTITMISSLIAAAVYALAVFFSNLGFGGPQQHDPVVRLLSLYLPIVLDAALLIFGILRAFVVKPKGAAK
jgi:uncharacterized membrane protein